MREVRKCPFIIPELPMTDRNTIKSKLIMSTIQQNLQAVHERMDAAAYAASRAPHDVNLLAVSKTFGADAVIEAAQAGQKAFGENYLQESLDKMMAVRSARPDLLLEWHFIGPIQ